jgi:hypothetical protein
MLLASFFTVSEALTYSVQHGMVIQGFPFHFVQHQDGSFFTNLSFNGFGFIATFIFWLTCVFSVWQLFVQNSTNRTRYIIIVISVAILLLNINIGSSPYCSAGFPIDIFNKCVGGSSIIPPLKVFLFKSIDFIFWLLISLLTVNFFRFMLYPVMAKLSYILAPLFLVILSVSYSVPCGGFICFSEGNGFPLGYYHSGYFLWLIFLIDFLIIAIIYFIFTKLVMYFKTKFLKNTLLN